MSVSWQIGQFDLSGLRDPLEVREGLYPDKLDSVTSVVSEIQRSEVGVDVPRGLENESEQW